MRMNLLMYNSIYIYKCWNSDESNDEKVETFFQHYSDDKMKKLKSKAFFESSLKVLSHQIILSS